MELNTKLELAVDIMATTIADAIKSGCEVGSEEFNLLMQEKEEMYKCNNEVLDKIINVYGKRINSSRSGK